MTSARLSHVVFFTLSDASPAAVQVLVDACHRYLKNHPGVVFFGAGTLASEYARPVNDRDFHVCLNVVFDSRASHDSYQTADDHLKFIAEHRDSWAKVRVFDAVVTQFDLSHVLLDDTIQLDWMVKMMESYRATTRNQPILPAFPPSAGMQEEWASVLFAFLARHLLHQRHEAVGVERGTVELVMSPDWRTWLQDAGIPHDDICQ